MKEPVLVEFPSNLGLTEPSPGKEPGVKYLPTWLKQHGLHHQISRLDPVRLEAPAYNAERDTATGYLNLTSIIQYARQQAELIRQLIIGKKLPFIVGGDCSILVGAAIALKQQGNYGLFYLDGHTDFMDISLSSTGGVGGMAASIVAGHGNTALSNIMQLSPYIKEEYVWCVGNREYDEEYEQEIRRSAATYIPLHLLREKGMKQCAEEFLLAVQSNGLDGFWLHIDVDVLNNDIMPCVDSPTAGGLLYEEFNELTGYLFSSDKMAGLEITILDPELDRDGVYSNMFVENITKTFNAARGSNR